MTKIPILNKSQKQVGLYDTEDLTYYRIINRREQFVHPKWEGMIAISRDILQRLIRLGCKKFQFTLTEWENEIFDVIIDMKTFQENMEELYFKNKENGDKQYGVRLQHWIRLYKNQARLT